MPKTKEQFEKIKDTKKKEIISSALYLFATQGYKATSIDDIMNNVGSAHSLFYHYFSSKEELFELILENIMDEMAKELSNITFDRKADEVMDELIDKILKMLPNKEKAQGIYLLLNLHLQKNQIPEPPENEEYKFRTIWNYIYNLVEKGQKEGDFLDGDPREYTIVLLVLIQGLAYKAMYIKKKNLITPNKNIIMNILRKEAHNV